MSSQQPLLEAAQVGNWEAIEQELQNDADINEHSNISYCRRTFRLLDVPGIDVDAHAVSRETPLFMAWFKG